MIVSNSKLARATGFLFLFILATSALSGGLIPELDADPDQIGNTLRNIAENPERYRASITFDLVSHMAIIAIASARMRTLKDSINRWANIIVGIVFIALSFLSPMTYLVDPSAHSAYLILVAILQIVVAALIVWHAWKWPKQESQP